MHVPAILCRLEGHPLVTQDTQEPQNAQDLELDSPNIKCNYYFKTHGLSEEQRIGFWNIIDKFKFVIHILHILKKKLCAIHFGLVI